MDKPPHHTVSFIEGGGLNIADIAGLISGITFILFESVEVFTVSSPR